MLLSNKMKSVRRPNNLNESELEKWFFNQKHISESGCWEWTRGMNSGYGVLRVNHSVCLVHRFSLELHLKRKIDKGIEVRHMCHNTKCFNPAHLEEGTHADNMHDMVIANRQAKGELLSEKCKVSIRDKIFGENNGRVKLTEQQVLQIKSERCLRMSTTDIASEYGVSKNQILRIQNGTSWKHLNKITE